MSQRRLKCVGFVKLFCTRQMDSERCIKAAIVVSSSVIKLKQTQKRCKNTGLADRCLSRMSPHYFVLLLGSIFLFVCTLLVSSLAIMCTNKFILIFFLQSHCIKEVTDATKGIIVMSLNLPSLSSGYENISLVTEFGSVSFPFLLSPWPPARQVPAVALPVPTQTGGLGRGAEEFWLGTPHVPRQPGGKEGNAVGAKHNANTDCFFWKGAKPGATTEALLCCWDNSTVHCVAPKSVQYN